MTASGKTDLARPSLFIRSIRISRALGINRADEFSIDGFRPGITIIHGPNGIGKSTLARVMMTVVFGGDRGVWRKLVGVADDRDEGASFRRLDVAGELVWKEDEPGEDRGSTVRVEITGNHVTRLRDGSPDKSITPSVSLCERYLLSLPDLLVSHGEGFAKEMDVQVSGGVRWNDRARALGWDKTPAAPMKLKKVAREALAELKKQSGLQRELESQRPELERMLKDIEKLEAEIGRKNKIDLLLRLKTCEREVAVLEQKLAEFDEVIAGLTGNELNQARSLDEKCDKCQTDERGHEDRRRRLGAEVPEQLSERERKADVVAIAALIEDLEKREREFEEAERALGGTRARLAKAARQLGERGEGAPDAGLAEINLEEILMHGRELADAAWRAGAMREIKFEFERQLEDFRSHTDSTANLPASDSVASGVGALADWLKAPVPSVGRRDVGRDFTLWLAIGVAASSLAAAICLWSGLNGAVSAWAAFATSAVALIASAIALVETLHRRESAGKASDLTAATVAQQRYLQLRRTDSALPAPSEWSTEAVTSTFEQLAVMRTAVEWRIAIEKMQREVERRGEALERRDADCKAQAVRLNNRLKGSADFADGTTQVWAAVLADKVVAWLSAWREEAESRERYESAGRALEAAREDLSKVFPTECGLAVRERTAIRARHDLEDLKTRIRLQAEYEDRQKYEMEKLEEARSRRIEAEEARAAFYASLGPDIRVISDVERLRRQWSEFDGLRKDRDAKGRVAEQLETQIGDDPELRTQDEESLGRRLKGMERAASDLSKLQQECANINASFGNAGGRSDVAKARDAWARANQALRIQEIKDADFRIGRSVLDWAQEVTRSTLAPRVVRRAQDYARAFTNAKLDLDIEPASGAEGPAFIARNGSEAWRSVDELSAGERVQLLMAVRMAFLEENESVRLPLFLDESLAAIDDDRGERIMDAVVDIARQGRQVFYFTSQLDEVDKWRSRLDPCKDECVDLEERRKGSVAVVRPRRLGEPTSLPIPSPEGRSREQYAEALGVPRVDWWDPDLSRLHVWYCVDDLDELRKLLVAGVKELVQLERHASDPSCGWIKTAADAAEHYASAFRAASKAWRRGRGRPLEAEAIAECRFVTETFRERAIAVLRESDRDGRRFLTRMLDLPHFKKGKALADWLREMGYVSDDEPLAHADIESEVRIALVGGGVPLDLIPGIVERVMQEIASDGGQSTDSGDSGRSTRPGPERP